MLREGRYSPLVFPLNFFITAVPKISPRMLHKGFFLYALAYIQYYISFIHAFIYFPYIINCVSCWNLSLWSWQCSTCSKVCTVYGDVNDVWCFRYFCLHLSKLCYKQEQPYRLQALRLSARLIYSSSKPLHSQLLRAPSCCRVVVAVSWLLWLWLFD